METRIKWIIESQSGKNDKEYLDFYIKLQAGRIPAQEKPSKIINEFCIFPINESDLDKISKILESSEDILLYFIKIGGLKLIRDSFDHGDSMLGCLEKIMKNKKLLEEF